LQRSVWQRAISCERLDERRLARRRARPSAKTKSKRYRQIGGDDVEAESKAMAEESEEEGMA